MGGLTLQRVSKVENSFMLWRLHALPSSSWFYSVTLTHCCIWRHFGSSNLCQHCLRHWLCACLVPSHHLKKCWLGVNCSRFWNKCKWNLKKDTRILIRETAFEILFMQNVRKLVLHSRYCSLPTPACATCRVCGGALMHSGQECCRPQGS